MATPDPVYLVHQPGEGLYGIADSLETAKGIAAERVQDYFGDPITWTAHSGGTTTGPYWEGRYHTYARNTAVVVVEQHQVRTAADMIADPTA